MKKALIFCNQKVPNAEPNSVRLINFGIMLKQLGYEEIILYGVNSDKEIVGEYKGIRFVEFSQTQGHGIIPRQKRKKELLDNVKKALLENRDVELIISAFDTCINAPHNYIRCYAKRYGISFAHSIVEWYGLQNLGGMKFFYRYLANEYNMRINNKKSHNIIAISTYLAEYYEKHGCHSVYIPTLIDTSEYENVIYHNNERIIIVYAGSPGRKDCLVNAVLALAELSQEERQRLNFRIFGTTVSKLKELGLPNEVFEKLGDTLSIYGRIPYEEVKYNVGAADYTILLRRNRLNANAGFSTKVGESMACGTPVIANITGDLAKYIKNGVTGIVCKDESIASCVNAYRQILGISSEQYAEMRSNTKKIAEIEFNLESYTDKLGEMLKVKK